MVFGAITKLNAAQRSVLNEARSVVARGITPTSYYNAKVAAGTFIRKTDWFAVVKYAAGIEKTGSVLRNVTRQHYPDVSKLIDSRTDMKNKFAYQVRVSWAGKYATDGTTKIYESVWVSTNEEHTAGWILDKAQEYLDTTETYENVKYVPLVIDAGLRKNPKFMEAEE